MKTQQQVFKLGEMSAIAHYNKMSWEESIKDEQFRQNALELKIMSIEELTNKICEIF